MRKEIYIIIFLLFILSGASEANVKLISSTLLGDRENLFKDYEQKNDSVLVTKNTDAEIRNDSLTVDSIRVTKKVNKRKSFFTSDVFYFIGTAALAAVIYLLLPEDNTDVENKSTFGKPPLPE